MFVAADNLQALTVDNNENLYVMLSTKKILKFTPTGERSIFDMASYPNPDMRFGPNGALYMQRKNYKRLYRLLPGATEAEEYADFKGKMNYSDFDEKCNIYGAGFKTEINIIHTDLSSGTGGYYKSYELVNIRVYNGYVYTLAKNISTDTTMVPGVYRNQILSDAGDPGENDVVLDWANTGVYSESEFYDITFFQSEDMLIAASHKDTILVVKPGGSQMPLYKNNCPRTGALFIVFVFRAK